MKKLFLFIICVLTIFCFSFAIKKIEIKESPILPFGEVHHLGWVVKDIHKTFDYWKKIGLDNISIRENVQSKTQIYRGKKMDAIFHTGFTNIGDVGFEIFQPVKGENPYKEFLEKHGEGIQHIAFALNSKEELESQIKRLTNLGIEIQERGSWETKEGTAHFVYLDASNIGGLFFELMFDPQYLKNKKEGKKITSENKYPLNKIIQYAMVVKDVDKLTDFYNKIGFKITRIDRDNKGLIRRYKGENEDLQMHMGWSKFGSVSLEIIQHTKGRSVYKDYLEKYGEGFHHIGINVKDMDEAIKIFKERGVEVSQDGAWGKTEVEGRFAYLETDIIGGLTIELLWSK